MFQVLERETITVSWNTNKMAPTCRRPWRIKLSRTVNFANESNSGIHTDKCEIFIKYSFNPPLRNWLIRNFSLSDSSTSILKFSAWIFILLQKIFSIEKIWHFIQIQWLSCWIYFNFFTYFFSTYKKPDLLALQHSVSV